MGTFFRLLLMVLLGVGGYALAKRKPHLARRLCQGILFALTVGLSVLAFSGASHDKVAIGQLHRWLGHVLVIMVGVSVPLMGGIFVQWRSQFKTPRMTVGIVFLLLLLVATVLGSMTGYLDVIIGNNGAGVETHNRFVVLHFFVFPACIAALLAGIWRIVCRKEENH